MASGPSHADVDRWIEKVCILDDNYCIRLFVRFVLDTSLLP